MRTAHHRNCYGRPGFTQALAFPPAPNVNPDLTKYVPVSGALSWQAKAGAPPPPSGTRAGSGNASLAQTPVSGALLWRDTAGVGPPSGTRARSGNAASASGSPRLGGVCLMGHGAQAVHERPLSGTGTGSGKPVACGTQDAGSTSLLQMMHGRALVPNTTRRSQTTPPHIALRD
jgi:hypothetical protein